MLLLIRARYPRFANILGFVIGLITLAIGLACGASSTVLILGGGSSVALSVLRAAGSHRAELAGRGTAGAR